MRIIENEHIVNCDVDLTLVGPTSQVPDLFLENPYSKTTEGFYIKHQHIELLKQYKARGMYIIVWTNGGVQWAKVVVEALGLQDIVDLIMTKPDKVIDDLDSKDILPKAIYLK